MTIGGRTVTGNERSGVEDPAVGEHFADAPVATPGDLDQACEAAAAAGPSWSALGEEERRAALMACGTALAARADEVARLLTGEQGKPLRDARAEVALAARWFADTAELSLGNQVLVDDGGARITLDRVPVGPVAAITPSNFPIILAVTKLAPALLAGNTVVLKPSPTTPLATLLVGELLGAVLPPGVLNTVNGGLELGPALVGHPAIRMVSFTGSIAAGRAIATAAAARFQPTVLELGGNDPCVVLPGTDPARVAESIFKLATVNSGQFCAAIKRVYVPHSERELLVEALCVAASSVTVGDGRDEATDLGPLVDARGRDRVAALVTEARRAGARIATGGRALPGPGYGYLPTVVTDLPERTALEEQEQFGPVIPVIGYHDVPEAVRRANGTDFGLGASVWGDPERAERVAGAIESGTVWINTHGDLRHDVPFGGVRDSGVGVEYGYWGLLEYTRMKVLNRAKA